MNINLLKTMTHIESRVYSKAVGFSFICVFISAILICSSCARGRSIPDGTYFGYEFMCNLSPEEDPHAEWFHANVLTAKGKHLTISNDPRYFRKGELWSSSSDGGFFTYEGEIYKAGTRTIVALQMTNCDYCLRRVSKDPEENLPTEYVVKYFKDGSFELNHVRYRRQKDPHYEFKPSSN